MISRFRSEVKNELRDNILPFWAEQMRDDERGGFYGQMTGKGEIVADAPRGAVMYARILWTFSAAYRIFGDENYADTARRAKEYLLKYFWDTEFGGIYWMVDADGKPLDTKKQFYALGFAIYGLSEYARATGDKKALAKAIELYQTIEEHSLDPIRGGYIEALARDWGEIADLRLSAKDANERKTMNTHLHILEPYTNLYRVWPDAGLRARIIDIISIFVEKIYRPDTGHLGLFFDDNWEDHSGRAVSYGHDIEASWLILEAAQVIGEPSLIGRVETICRHIADAAMEGSQPDGSMVYETHADGTLDSDRHWWVQAETVVGLMWLWKYHGCEDALPKALKTWEYIKHRLVDRAGGEWFWSIRGDGLADTDDDKAGFWKCPYHNGRMCMEVLARTEE
jgi:mannobiose 2-epimerase